MAAMEVDRGGTQESGAEEPAEEEPGAREPPVAPGPVPGLPAGLLALFATMSVVALAISIVALVVAAGGDGDGGAPGAAAPLQTAAVELGDLYVEPERIEVAAGTRLVVEVTNNGDQEHDLSLNGETGTDRLQPGDTQAADFGVIEAATQAWCTVPGHKDAGMLLDIAVG